MKTVFLGLIAALSAGAYADSAIGNFLVLNYHDIVVTKDLELPDARFSTTRNNLEIQFKWLQDNGYRAIDIQYLIDVKNGKKIMPEKAILLTFDDGYLSFYTEVLPLLKKHHFPAIISIVGSWLGQKNATNQRALMSTNQLREVVQTGLVEIASHSYDLHRGVIVNALGDYQSAATGRKFSDNRYETEDDYRKRIFSEIEKSAEHLFQSTGIRPRVMVWPYGDYNSVTLEAAKHSGMSFTMALSDGNNSLADLGAMKRLIITDDPNIQQFSRIVREQRVDQSLRVAQIDMDYVYDDDDAQTMRNTNALINRIKASGVNTVFLQAYADPDGDGIADQLYFPNRHLPVRRDLFNHVATQLRVQAHVKVYAWLPILSYIADLPDEWYVHEWKDGEAEISKNLRLSPFNPAARQFIGDIFEDLAIHCDFNGVLFHDDGFLSDFEDVSPLALEFNQKTWGLPAEFEELHAMPKLRMHWAKYKTEFISQFTDFITNKIRLYRPGIQTARNLFALPILNELSEEWYAQSLDNFLKHYDYVALEAMPFMEGAKNPTQWLHDLTNKVATYPMGLNKTIFELQTVDWKNKQDVPTAIFVDQVKFLEKNGVRHIGYYPDNFHANNPNLLDLERLFVINP